MTFKEEVKKELEGLSREQQVEFAWRCAVRALPFLGAHGNFDYWGKGYRQKYLLNIFHALDTVPINLSAVNAAVNAAAAIVADAAAAAAANTAAANAAADANAAAVFASASAQVYDYYNNAKIDLNSLIRKDLEFIKTGIAQQLTVVSYGVVWSNFQKALISVGCSYWAQLYQSVFENNFDFDHKKKERRLNLPQEIKEQGAAIAGEYLEKLERQGAKRLNEARIIILGDKGVGKTCVARRLKDPAADMTTDAESTAGVETTLWELEEEDINVRIWDFAGHTVTHAVHQFFLSARCLYIMVYDGRSEKRNDLEYWLNHMKNYGGDSKAIILVNERDKHAVKIPINKLKEKYPIAGFYSFDVDKNKKKLSEFREVVADYIKNNPSWKNQEIPTSYYRVKEELENRFNEKNGQPGKDHITKEVLEEIAGQYDVEDCAQLLQDLHALGISLWYQDMDNYNTLILNPEWISEGVYKIINWASNKSKHEVTLASFSKIFKEELARYPKDKHLFLFNLIKHYELAFEIRGRKSLVIPHLLQEDQPAELPKFEEGESLIMRYEADQPLPPHTISRFIVRHNEQIKKEGKDYLIWKYGVILENEYGDIALVREKDYRILVSVKGIGKTKYISELRATLNAIFESYNTERPELTYKIIDPDLGKGQELFLLEQAIVALEQQNRPYFDYRTGRDISMQQTVIHYHMENPVFHVSGSGASLIMGQGNQVSNTFNFYESKTELQGEFTQLARKLAKKGKAEEAEEFTDFVEELDEIEKDTSPEEIKKKGIFNRLKRLAEDLGDKDSKLYKAVEGVRNGFRIAKGIIDIVEKIPPIF